MDLLIFDMDGVLIDVSKSYRKVIERTAQLYLQTCLGFRDLNRNLTEGKDVSLFKSVKGFNSDWDVTSALLLYLLSHSPLPPDQKRKKPSSIEDLISHLKKESSQFSSKKKCFFRKKSLPAFLKEVDSRGGGLNGVRQVLRGGWEGWVYGSGDLHRENLVQRIFQEVYLGEKFSSHYHLRPILYKGKGYYRKEKLLIPRKILSSLRKKARLGIASGRTRFEAELALRRFRLSTYFDALVTLDECEKEERRILQLEGKEVKCSKPSPYSILRAVQEIGLPQPKCGYVGDVVDDMLAARSAKKELEILAIGFISHPKERHRKKSLLKAGADLVIENPKDLLQLW
ncbi:MAG: HAD family hydrolase [Thermodesulfobacteriota bacterium]